MQISVLTLFPDLYDPFLKASIVGRAHEKKTVTTDVVNLFNFCQAKERIDSTTFGHGPGMLIKSDMIEKAIEGQDLKHGRAFKVFFSPQGTKLDQQVLKALSQEITKANHLMLITSRYEGIDARVEEYYADAVISIGDFVLMGGDLPAMSFIEAFLRLIPGVIGKQESVEEESFSGPFVDFPHYAAPVVWKNMEVPEVLRSGNHALINAWRQRKAALKTVSKHFEWLRSFKLNKEQISLAKEFIPNHYAVLMHGDILLKDDQPGTTSVTSIDIHDIARSACTFGLKNYFLVTPLEDQQKIVRTLMDFWITGPGAEYNAHRYRVLKAVRLCKNLDQVIEEISKMEDKKPLLIATSAKRDEDNDKKYITFYDQSKVWAQDRPVLFIMGTGHGLVKQVLDRCDFILEPITGFSDFNHLSVRSASAIIFDRWLGVNIKYK